MPKKSATKAERWLLSKQIEELRVFASDGEQRKVCVDKPIKDVRQLLRKKPTRFRELMGLVSGSFEVLGGWWGAVGAVTVLRGDVQGWGDIAHQLLLQSFSSWIRHAWITRDQMWDKEVVSCSLMFGVEPHTLCHAIAMGNDSWAHPFGRHLLSNFRNFGRGDRVYFYTEALHPFVLKMFAKWVGEDLDFRPDVEKPLGRYHQIFDTWADPQRFGQAIVDICDYHCEQCFDGPGYPMFVYPPYNIFPVEIISLLRIRRVLGLDTPTIAHRLLDSPLMHPPSSATTGER